MKIQSLRYFVTLVQAGSITKAAQQLYVAQPSLTKSLKLLEEELGYPLVERSASGVHLTKKGCRVYAEAQQVLDLYDGWKAMGRDDQPKLIDIYTYLSFPDFLLPDIVLRYRKKYPELVINFTVTEQPERFISRSGHKPVLALVMCREGEHLRRLTEIQGNPPVLLMSGAYRCLVNTRHPLAQRKEVTFEQLRDYYLILPDLDQNERVPEMPEGFLHGILCLSPDQKKVEVETVANVIPLVEKDNESYALSFWPAALRYKGVQEGRLIGVPIVDECARGQFMLFYSKAAYETYPVVRQLVEDIRAASRAFSRQNTPSSWGANTP